LSEENFHCGFFTITFMSQKCVSLMHTVVCGPCSSIKATARPPPNRADLGCQKDARKRGMCSANALWVISSCSKIQKKMFKSYENKPRPPRTWKAKKIRSPPSFHAPRSYRYVPSTCRIALPHERPPIHHDSLRKPVVAPAAAFT
jgi:hypothetical protein